MALALTCPRHLHLGIFGTVRLIIETTWYLKTTMQEIHDAHHEEHPLHVAILDDRAPAPAQPKSKHTKRNCIFISIVAVVIIGLGLGLGLGFGLKDSGDGERPRPCPFYLPS